MNESPTIRKTIKAFFYLLPALAVLIVFNLYPIIKSFIMGFYTDYDYFKDEVYARGFDNYQYILQDDEFWSSMYNTLIYVIGVVPISILLSLGIAVMLNQNIRLRGLFRTIYFVPFVTSVVAVSIVWRWIFHTEYGVLNYFLSFIGIDAIEWLTHPQWAMPSLIILAIWKGLGYNIIIFLAGLQNVNKQYYLAAQIDGASKWERFKNITVPLISPTTFFISIISIINAFKVFDEVFALFGGQSGPAGSAQTIVYYIFNRFYGDWDFGVASAAAYMLFLVIFIFTLIQLYVGKKKVNY
ncbi:sugar ABC transporter permease [Virgibacillus salarius]|uniref:carbohydrate ABC transporter permease n=1 Tax=Virgibacillus salarius TaxID=447199 RepID=UPI002493596D|nr:sugar ABC transporter permease [Virgibacillus salarius]WBX81625.1 sugar ABC transporter permease [Virgibacillus salarius]